jgi:hypothetical protein
LLQNIFCSLLFSGFYFFLQNPHPYQQAANQIKQDKLKIPEPYADIRTELKEKLKHVIDGAFHSQQNL